MVGKPDPMMMPGFPKETTFSAYLSLRNTTEKPMDVALQLNYMPEMGMGGSAPVTRNLPAQHLAPFDAKQVDLQGLLNAAGLKDFNGSINLSTSFSGRAGDLVLATGSVDQSGTYVFEVEPQGVGSSKSKFANYWGVANGNDTMFSLWNPTDAPQDIVATFYYGNGSGKYTVPIHLDGQASVMIDMAMLIAEIKPDADGNIIPPSVQEGSAQFASAKGRNEKITLVIAAGIYNVSTATCGGGCIQCCGDSNFGISPNPIFCPIGETMPCSSTAVDCNGYSVFPSSWSSSNTAVMTVDGSGNVHGVSAGSATITANFLGVPVYTGQLCSGGSCPSASPAPQAPANVTPKIRLGGSNGTDITGTTQSVVTGQQIVLYGDYGAGVSVNSQLWTVPGTIVAGYTASSSSGSLNTNVTLNQQQATFYWVFALSGSQTVTFTLNYGNNQTATASATFNVTGPTNGSMTSSPATNLLSIDDWSANGSCIAPNPAGIYLVYGNISFSNTCVKSGNRGISFTGSMSGGTGGNAFFVQLVTSGSISGGRSCTIVPGLDTAGYPYPFTNDSPAVQLLSTYTTLSRTENFKMYLMWQYSTGTTIPVPIGYQQWGFSGSANCSTSCGSAANWTATTQSGGPSGGFVQAVSTDPNYDYPTWTGIVGGC